MLRVGVIGCGTIGGEICLAIDSGQVQAELVGIHDVMATATERLARRLRQAPPVLSQEEVIDAADLVVEATSRDVAPGIIRAALGHGRDIMVMSVGGLLGCLDDALALAKSGNRHIYVPTGAIAALDAVKGAAVATVSRVTLTTRKPPQALAGAPFVVNNQINLEGFREPTVIFTGSAAEAVPAFPANVNVAAALSLAGIGPQRTQVRVIADPTCDRNIHEIEMEGSFGRMVARMENVPSPNNPKTSYMASLSAIALLRRLTAPLVIGT
ncbi:MAG: aspartate dehydrogenase [candidate division NC10 bacterium RBG_16_65_8]|nr:MAG: aspartate dehydrogenase [candidate division NC10 bacterium RBG_16_65_8]